MRVNRVRLEVIWKCAQDQFVKDMSLVYTDVVVHFVVTPICEVLRRVVDLFAMSKGVGQFLVKGSPCKIGHLVPMRQHLTEWREKRYKRRIARCRLAALWHLPQQDLDIVQQSLDARKDV